MARLAIDKENKDALHDAGAIRLLLCLLRTGEKEEIRERAAQALDAIQQGSAHLQESLALEGGAPVLLGMLPDPNASVLGRHLAAKAIVRLAQQPCNIPIIVAANAAEIWSDMHYKRVPMLPQRPLLR